MSEIDRMYKETAWRGALHYSQGSRNGGSLLTRFRSWMRRKRRPAVDPHPGHRP